MLSVLASYRACAEAGAPPDVGTNCGTLRPSHLRHASCRARFAQKLTSSWRNPLQFWSALPYWYTHNDLTLVPQESELEERKKTVNEKEHMSKLRHTAFCYDG